MVIDAASDGSVRQRAILYLDSSDFHFLCKHTRKPLQWIYNKFIAMQCSNFRTAQLVAHKNQIPFPMFACSPQDFEGVSGPERVAEIKADVEVLPQLVCSMMASAGATSADSVFWWLVSGRNCNAESDHCQTRVSSPKEDFHKGLHEARVDQP